MYSIMEKRNGRSMIKKIAKIREEREARREEYEQKIIAEKEKVEEARKRYYDAIKAQG